MKIRLIIAYKGNKEKNRSGTKGLDVMRYQIASLVVHDLSFREFYIFMEDQKLS